MRALVLCLLSVLLVPPSARAQTGVTILSFAASPGDHVNLWHIDFRMGGNNAMAGALSAQSLLSGSILREAIKAQDQNPLPLHTAAVEHSAAYQTRAKVHKYASFATLPLFAAEVALGQALYNTPANAGGKRAAHAFVGAGSWACLA
jgi:hypothetical protein